MTYYIYKGHIYEKCGTARMKDSTRGWVDAITYKRADYPADKDKQQIFVREKSSFDQVFETLELEDATISFVSLNHSR